MPSQTPLVDLVEETYATVVEPMRYDAFMQSWDQYVEACLEHANNSSLADLQNSPIHAHFARGLELLDHLGRTRRRKETAADLVNQTPGESIVVDETGIILAANSEAEAQIDAFAGKGLADTRIDQDAVDRIVEWMSKPARTTNSFLFARCRVGNDRHNACFLATSITVPEDDHPENSDPVKHYLISSIDLQLNHDTVDVLIDAFGLSQAEAQVAIALAEGLIPNEIAKKRSASINTIRTQIKKILKKTHANGIPDLVRILCGFAAGYSANENARRTALSGSGGAQSLLLPDGRRLSYVEYGNPNGRPVLFVHAMLFGTKMSDRFVEACHRLNWRIIAPSRPGFGNSDLNASVKGADLVDQTVGDMRYLLDRLDIDRTLVLGHVAGSIYAQRFASKFPERTRGLLFVNHAPHWQDALLDDLPRRQRLIARTTQFAPAALPFLTRAGVAVIDSGGHDQFIQALYQHTPVDITALRRPDVYQMVVDGLQHTVMRGSAGFCRDCPLVLMDWTVQAPDIPINILHGAGDMVVTKNYIQGYCERVPHAKKAVIDNAGQFLFYSHWPRVLDKLKLLDKQSA